MAYFIHNKYDKNSVAALALIDQGANTVIDYYSNYDTYKYLDVSAGFGKLYDTLSYITPNTILFDTDVTDGKSYFNFSTSIIIKSIQRGSLKTSSNYNNGVTVNINPINADKAVFTFTLLYGAENSTYLEALNNTSFTIQTNYSGPISYQIVEYY